MASLKIKQNEQWVDLGIVDTHNMPAGGSTNQVLTKMSDADYDFAWTDVEAPESGGANIPVGAIFPYPDENVPEGYLWCNGDSFSKEEYPTLGEICDKHFGFKWQTYLDLEGYDDMWQSEPFFCNLSALTVGNEYNICIGEKQYTQELKMLQQEISPGVMGSFYYFGNLHLMNSEMEDTGETFIWICFDVDDEVFPMPPYYNTIGGTEYPPNPYIKVSINSTKVFAAYGDGFPYVITEYFPYFNFFKENEYYDIKFNGSFYHSKCTSCSGYPIKLIGNMALFEPGWEDTGEPFCLMVQSYEDESVLLCITENSGMEDEIITVDFLIDENLSFLPDLTGLTIAGYKPNDEFFGTIGGVAGSLYHEHYINGTTLTQSQIPAHTHTRGTMNITGDFGAYWKGAYEGWGANNAFYSGSTSTANTSAYTTNFNTDKVVFDASRSWTGETSSVGGGQAHYHYEDSESSLQPTISMIWMVKAKEMPEIEAIVEDTLTSDSPTNALSAKQGKVLNEKSIPAGGTEGQVLGKASDGDNDVEWISNPGGVDFTPVGTIMPYPGIEAPIGYAICDGRRINKADYPEYAEKFKTTYMPGVLFSTEIIVPYQPMLTMASEPFYPDWMEVGQSYSILVDGKPTNAEFKMFNTSLAPFPLLGFGNGALISPDAADTGEDYLFFFISGNCGFVSSYKGPRTLYLPYIMGYGNTSGGNIYTADDDDDLSSWKRLYQVGDSLDVDIYQESSGEKLGTVQGIWKHYTDYYEDTVIDIYYVGNLNIFDSSFPDTGESFLFANMVAPWLSKDYILQFGCTEDSPFYDEDYVYYIFKLHTTENSYPYVYVPDLRQKTIAGYDAHDYEYGFFSLNGTIGDFYHSHYINGTVLSVNQMPKHSHETTFYNDDFSNGGDSGRTLAEMKESAGLTYDVSYKSGSWVKGTSETGGNQSHNHYEDDSSSLQPTMIMNYIIKIAMLSRADISDNSKVVNVFSPVKKYNVGDIVLHNKVLYRCKKAITEPGEWTGLDRTIYRNLQVGDDLSGKTIQFNWPTYFPSTIMFPLMIEYDGSLAPWMGPSSYDEILTFTTILDMPEEGEPTYSDSLVGYSLDETTEPEEYWIDWSIPQIAEITYGTVPGLVGEIAPGFENTFKIAEEVEGNWEVYSDPSVYKLQDQNLLFSLQHALQSESEIYSLTPESLGWSGVEEILAACQDYDNNLYIDAFEHILRLEVGENAGETTYILTIPDNTLTLLIDDEPVQITYHGYFFIVTGTQFGDRANFQIFKKTFETPKATQNSIGGIQLYFDSNSNTLYMSNNGTVPGPWTWFLLPNSGMSQIIEGTTWRNWVNGEGPETERETFEFIYQEDVGKSYIIDWANGQYVGYDGEFVTADDVIIPEVQYEYLTLGPTVSTFTVTSRGMLPTDPTKTDVCTFEEGMTWREFVNSPYGTYWDIGEMGGTIFLTYNNDDTGCYGALYDEDLDSPIIADTDYMLA